MKQLSVFDTSVRPTDIPLAEKVRPHSLEDIKGQDKLLAAGTALRRMIEPTPTAPLFSGVRLEPAKQR